MLINEVVRKSHVYLPACWQIGFPSHGARLGPGPWGWHGMARCWMRIIVGTQVLAPLSIFYVIRDGSRERGRRYNVADVTSHVTSPDSLTPRVSQSVRLTGGGWRHACASAGRARVVNACTFFAPHPSPRLAWIESVRVCRPGQGLPFGGPAQGRDSGGLSPTTITTRNTHATRSRRRLYNYRGKSPNQSTPHCTGL